MQASTSLSWSATRTSASLLPWDASHPHERKRWRDWGRRRIWSWQACLVHQGCKEPLALASAATDWRWGRHGICKVFPMTPTLPPAFCILPKIQPNSYSSSRNVESCHQQNFGKCVQILCDSLVVAPLSHVKKDIAKEKKTRDPLLDKSEIKCKR